MNTFPLPKLDRPEAITMHYPAGDAPILARAGQKFILGDFIWIVTSRITHEEVTKVELRYVGEY